MNPMVLYVAAGVANPKLVHLVGCKHFPDNDAQLATVYQAVNLPLCADCAVRADRALR